MGPLPSGAEFRTALLSAELLFDGGVDGLYQRSGTFEDVVAAITRAVVELGSDQQAQVRHFAPVLPRKVFEQTDYVRSFPDLVGSISTFVGNDADHARLLRVAEANQDWSSELVPAEVMMVPAVCHPLYPTLQGEIGYEGRVFQIHGAAFRHEPSLEPTRMQSFRTDEFVYVGSAQGAIAHQDHWLRRGLELLSGLGLTVESVVANDPFFGRTGRMLAANQRQSALKYEIVAPISGNASTAISSANYHQDHFGEAFSIHTPDGAPAHSACVGFGLERITLALLSRHGLEVAGWPEPVRRRLWS